MATRKRRSPAISLAGRGARPDEPAPSGQLPLSDAELSSPQPPAPGAQGEAEPEAKSDPSGLAAQVAAMRQQQAAQQQQPQVDPLAHYLASIPGLTIPKFHFLYHYFAQHPHLLNADHWQLLKAAHDITLGRGVKEDSGEYFQAMDALLRQHAAMPPAPAPASPPPMPEPRPQPMTHIDLEKVESPEGEPEEVHIRAEHVAAPVSRGDYAHTVEPEMSPSSIRLTPEQRDIAARTGISEAKYAEGVLKLQKMKKSKLVSE
jgi:hypothetical protein